MQITIRACAALVFLQRRLLFPVTARSTVGPMVSVSQFELSGTGVVVVLKLSDVWVSVHGEVDFLQVRGGLVVILGASGALVLLLPAHFLIDRSMRLWFAMRPELHLQHMFGFFLDCDRTKSFSFCFCSLDVSS